MDDCNVAVYKVEEQPCQDNYRVCGTNGISFIRCASNPGIQPETGVILVVMPLSKSDQPIDNVSEERRVRAGVPAVLFVQVQGRIKAHLDYHCSVKSFSYL